MIEKHVQVPTKAGQMRTFVVHPEQGGPFPAVVVYMDIWGIREELYDIARRIASVGYYCVVPDLYYREGNVRFEYRDANNRMMSLKNLDAAKQKQVLSMLDKLSNAMVVEDTAALLQFFRGEPAAGKGPKGSIGFCMGGRHLMCVAAAYPDEFRASASLHGTTLISDAADSPHHVLNRIKGEVYGGFAEVDPYAPLDMVAQLDGLLTKHSVRHVFNIHKGAVHGYALTDRDIYDKRAMERDWGYIFAMFDRQLRR